MLCNRFKLLLFCLIFLVVACGESNEKAAPVEIVETEGNLDQYGQPIPEVPEMEVPQDIDQLTLSEARLLRNEIFARKGWLFKDASLRTYFFRNRDWYHPEYEYNKMREAFTADEEALIEQLKAREEILLKSNFEDLDAGLEMNTRNIVNTFQYDSNVIRQVGPVLRNHGIAVMDAEHEQLFHVYDENNYNEVPSFVTTDLFLQLIHTFFSYELRELEGKHLSKSLENLLEEILLASEAMGQTIEEEEVVAAAQFNRTYFGIALELLTGTGSDVPENHEELYQDAIENIRAASGRGSELLNHEFYDFTVYKLRGHYTRSEELKRYFQTMMWLQNAPILSDSNLVGMDGMILAAYYLQQNDNLKYYDAVGEPIRFLVGDPDNLSMTDLVDVIRDKFTHHHPVQLLHRDVKKEILSTLRTIDPEQIKTRTRQNDTLTQTFLQQLTLHFMPQRYTFDAEILQRLVKLEGQDGFRPMPKGIDVMAALGHAPAEDILLNTYQETKRWEGYDDTLAVLQHQFSQFDDWDKNLYNNWMQGLKALGKVDERAPFFMQSTGWERKSMNTVMASWAELKHDVILYAKQPTGAQMGGGDGDYPSPVLLGYVEPHPEFWKTAMKFLETNRSIMQKFGYFTDNLKYRTEKLLELLSSLNTISEKELEGKKLSDEEYEFIRYIGGEVEQLTLEIMDAPYMSWFEVSGPDKFLAVVADVYTYNAANPEEAAVLEEGVGYGNEIYVAVEINGYLHLMKGAVFSYYEFDMPINSRLSDEEWQGRLRAGQAPPIPVWMDEIKAY